VTRSSIVKENKTNDRKKLEIKIKTAAINDITNDKNKGKLQMLRYFVLVIQG